MAGPEYMNEPGPGNNGGASGTGSGSEGMPPTEGGAIRPAAAEGQAVVQPTNEVNPQGFPNTTRSEQQIPPDAPSISPFEIPAEITRLPTIQKFRYVQSLPKDQQAEAARVLLPEMSGGSLLDRIRPNPGGPLGPEGPKGPENLGLPENEKHPSFNFVVTRIRKLEAMRVEQRYNPGTPENPYPNLRELEFRYKQFEEYAATMASPEISQLMLKLKNVIDLETGLLKGEEKIKEALELFDENGQVDPRLRGLDRQVEILKGIVNPTYGQKIALQVAEEQRTNEVELEGEQGIKAKLRHRIQDLEHEFSGFSKQDTEQKIAALKSKSSLSLEDKVELDQNRDKLVRFRELGKNKESLLAYETYNSPNIIVERIKNLRGDHGKETELRRALTEFLREERSRLETEIDLMEVIGDKDNPGCEQIITNELKEPGQVEMEEWENKALQADREAEKKQEEGEIPFKNLPVFSNLVALQESLEYGVIERNKKEFTYDDLINILKDHNQGFVDFLNNAQQTGGKPEVQRQVERQIERYLFKAFRLGITKGVHDAFDDLYAQYKMPEVGYYGDVHRVAVGNVHHLEDSFRGMDRGDKFRLKGWHSNFLGVIAFAAQRAGTRMEDIVAPSIVNKKDLNVAERALLAQPDLRLLRGEWGPERAAKKVEAVIEKRMYWEKSVYGNYQFKIDTEVSKNPYAAEQLRMAADQWIAYLQSGVIPKNPQDQLKEWQQFIGQLAPLAEKIFRQMYPEDAATLKIHPENKGRASKEIRRLRQELKFRAEAPVAAYANAVDEAEAFASMHQNLSEDTEGPEVWRQGYGALNGMVALALDRLENDPEYARVYFHPEGSRGYLSANNAAQRLLEKTVCEQLSKELAQWSLSDRTTNTGRVADSLNKEIARVNHEMEAIKDNPYQEVVLQERLNRLKQRQQDLSRISRSDELNVRIAQLNAEIAKYRQEADKEGIDPKRISDLNNRLTILETGKEEKIKERIGLSKVIRRENHQRIGLDQSRDDFKALYGKLEEQDDFKLLSDSEKELVRKRKELEAEAAIRSAIDILNITGQLSARSGPTIKIIRNPEILKYQYKIEQLNEVIDDNEDLLKIPADKRTDEQKKRVAIITENTQNALKNQLEQTRADYGKAAKTLRASGREIDARADYVPVRTVVRFAQYAVYRAEKIWAEEADRIMKGNQSKQDKDTAIQELCSAIIPDAWNIKKGQKLNLTDVLEGVYREALDRVVGDWVRDQDGTFVNRVQGKGFQATLEVPVVVEEGGKRVVKKQILRNAAGETLYFEDIDRLPESNGMLMAYYGTEEIMNNTISLPYKVAEARDGKGGLLGRALRILDPAFNRLNREDNPDLNDFQKLQRAIHAGVEAQWQRHFQIKIEVLERSVIGADIRKNKTGRKEDRYKIIDGNPRNNLLEFGRERLYVTGRIINHAAEILTHADRRTRRAPDLGLYSPMQHESEYDEDSVSDTRERMGLIDAMSAAQASREGSRLDFLYLKLKGMRWGVGYKQRVALESGPVEGGKQHTGLLEKIYTNGDRLNKMWDSWVRSYERLRRRTKTDVQSDLDLEITNATADTELEDFISTAEGSDERLKISAENLYPDLSYYRLAQAPLWKDGVDPFLPDGTLNFERGELGKDNTLLGSDNGTSRHTTGIWFERVKQWKMDSRKGHRWYPGTAHIAQNLDEKRWIFRAWQSANDVLKSREVR